MTTTTFDSDFRVESRALRAQLTQITAPIEIVWYSVPYTHKQVSP